jgi:aryl-alcohol dehydrogenase-like predicted oxidoreductase
VTTLSYRLLGKTGLRVSQAFLGAMTFGEQGGVGAPLAECQRMLDAYADAGGNVIDTAINYRGGASEEIVGELLAGRRDRFVLSTKYTVTRDPSDPNAAGNHRKNLLLSLETSLRRLRTDYIDLYWVHIWDRATPTEETMRALDDAVRAGKILYLGVSDTPAWVVSRANMLAECHGWTPFVALQVPYSLVNREIERELLPMAEALGMSVAAWSPLAGGILSGKYTRGGAPSEPQRLNADAVSERDLEIVRAVQTVAAELGASAAQVAIAWTMAKSPALHPILGARRREQLVENLGALEVELPADAVAQLDAVTRFEVGFPLDFIAKNSAWVFGAAAQSQDRGRRA